MRCTVGQQIDAAMQRCMLQRQHNHVQQQQQLPEPLQLKNACSTLMCRHHPTRHEHLTTVPDTAGFRQGFMVKMLSWNFLWQVLEASLPNGRPTCTVTAETS